MTNLRKSMHFWIAILAVVLVGVAALFVAMRPDVSPAAPAPGSYLMSEVAAARTAERCWAAIGDGVYDFTPYAQNDARILTLCGTDATTAVSTMGPGAADNFGSLRIGTLRKE